LHAALHATRRKQKEAVRVRQVHAWEICDAARAPGSASPVSPLWPYNGEGSEVNTEISRVRAAESVAAPTQAVKPTCSCKASPSRAGAAFSRCDEPVVCHTHGRYGPGHPNDNRGWRSAAGLEHKDAVPGCEPGPEQTIHATRLATDAGARLFQRTWTEHEELTGIDDEIREAAALMQCGAPTQSVLPTGKCRCAGAPMELRCARFENRCGFVVMC
jgi:hypothetical protein